MNSLLTADWHLTDVEIENYRWGVFDFIQKLAVTHKVTHLFILGDFTDRKDRHSGFLLNRMVKEFRKLSWLKIYILSGNHDQPLNGPYYWEFLDSINAQNNVYYITEPVRSEVGAWLLPFSANPVRDWAKLNFTDSRALLMHQTVQGARVEGDRVMESAPHPMPSLPSMPVYSGDVHRPQQVNGVIYVGTPHPVRFSETWENRVLLIENNNFTKYKAIPIETTKRAILDISSSDELPKTIYKAGDQLRIRYMLSGMSLATWPVEEQKIREWAKKRGVYLASVDAKIIGDGVDPSQSKDDTSIELMPPNDIVKLFGESEKLSDEIIDMGLELISESKR